MCFLISLSNIREAVLNAIFWFKKRRKWYMFINWQKWKIILERIWYENGLYKVILWKNRLPNDLCTQIAQAPSKSHIWHICLGYISNALLEKTIGMVRDIRMEKLKSVKDCTTCLKTMSTRDSRPSFSRIFRTPLRWRNKFVYGWIFGEKSEAPDALQEMINEL